MPIVDHGVEVLEVRADGRIRAREWYRWHTGTFTTRVPVNWLAPDFYADGAHQSAVMARLEARRPRQEHKRIAREIFEDGRDPVAAMASDHLDRGAVLAELLPEYMRRPAAQAVRFASSVAATSAADKLAAMGSAQGVAAMDARTTHLLAVKAAMDADEADHRDKTKARI